MRLSDSADDKHRSIESRGQFLRSAAIKGAVTSLFGAVTLDSVMAKAMDRVEEVKAIKIVGTETADGVLHFAVPTCLPGTNFTCIDYQCTGTFGCTVRQIYCTTWFMCSDTFNCTPADFGCGLPKVGCDIYAFTCGSVFNANY